MKAIHMGLIDLGAAIDLDAVEHLAGHPAHRVDLLAGTPGARSGPFTAPLQAVLDDGGDKVTLRVHAPGVLVVRRERDGGLSDEIWPDDLGAWRERVRIDLGPALYDPYDVAPAEEAYDLRVAHDRPEGAAQFIMTGATKAMEPELLERESQGVLLGRDQAVLWGDDEGIAESLDVLELARAILVEFRTYDTYLDRRLDRSFRSLDRLWAAGGLFRSARAALRDLSQVRVEVARLTDPLHGTDKTFGDRFAERLHALAQQRLRISSWQDAVGHKTEVLEDMFHLAQEEANHRRALVLESMIVLLFILDLYLLFKLE